MHVRQGLPESRMVVRQGGIQHIGMWQRAARHNELKQDGTYLVEACKIQEGSAGRDAVAGTGPVAVRGQLAYSAALCISECRVGAVEITWLRVLGKAHPDPRPARLSLQLISKKKHDIKLAMCIIQGARAHSGAHMGTSTRR